MLVIHRSATAMLAVGIGALVWSTQTAQAASIGVDKVYNVPGAPGACKYLFTVCNDAQCLIDKIVIKGPAGKPVAISTSEPGPFENGRWWWRNEWTLPNPVHEETGDRWKYEWNAEEGNDRVEHNESYRTFDLLMAEDYCWDGWDGSIHRNTGAWEEAPVKQSKSKVHAEATGALNEYAFAVENDAASFWGIGDWTLWFCSETIAATAVTVPAGWTYEIQPDASLYLPSYVRFTAATPLDPGASAGGFRVTYGGDVLGLLYGYNAGNNSGGSGALPEPSTASLLLCGLAAIALRRLRRT